MSNDKETAELHRKIAEKIDNIVNLEAALLTQTEISRNLEEQLSTEKYQTVLLRNQLTSSEDEKETWISLCKEWSNKEADERQKNWAIKRTFNNHAYQTFECLLDEVPDPNDLSVDNYENELQYSTDCTYYDNIRFLIKELIKLKGDYLNGSEGEEEQEQLHEF